MKIGMAFHDEDLCLADSATTHTILNEKKYFKYLTLTKVKSTIISGPANIIKGFIRANILLPNNKKPGIKDALYSSKSIKILLSFKDMCTNCYHN
jgi:hypothetical protein